MYHTYRWNVQGGKSLSANTVNAWPKRHLPSHQIEATGQTAIRRRHQADLREPVESVRREASMAQIHQV